MAVKEVPFFDLKRQVDGLMPELRDAVMSILENCQFALGDAVAEFEDRVAQFVESGHAVAVASGTDALILSLKAMGVGPGDGVITTPFTFFSTASSIIHRGARPLFVDINPRTFNIDPSRIEIFLNDECRRDDEGVLRHISSGGAVRGIIPVHIFGQMADMEALQTIAEREGLFILEDGAQAFGAWDEREGGERLMAGSIGEAGIFSFYPTKNLGAFGDAGMVVTSNNELAGRIRTLRVHGSGRRDIFDEIGYCSRMDTIQAAVLLAKFPHIEKWNERRGELARNYIENIKSYSWSEELVLPFQETGKRHIYHQFVVRTSRRDELMGHLGKNGVGYGIYYSHPLHLQPALQYLKYKKGDLPESENAAGQAFALPIWPELTEGEQGQVVKILNLFYTNM